MHNLVIVGALTFVVATGVGPASDVSSTGQWRGSLARLNSVTAPYFTKDFGSLRTLAARKGSDFKN
jgi:hypothetical protein